MATIKTIAEWMTERRVRMPELAAMAAVEVRVIEAIAKGRYTPSPAQRQRLATALNVAPEQVVWGHFAQVDHIQGHGPQFGRSP